MTEPAGIQADESAVTPPNIEEQILINVQKALLPVPGSVKVARGMSHFGEHALGWMGTAAFGMLVDRRHRRQWAEAGLAAFIAHAASVIIKRIVRRRRPSHPCIEVHVGTPSKLSFPSSHTSSTTAWATAVSQGLGTRLPRFLIIPMVVSRMLLGVHYASDTMTGVIVGASTTAFVRRTRLIDRLPGVSRIIGQNKQSEG